MAKRRKRVAVSAGNSQKNTRKKARFQNNVAPKARSAYALFFQEEYAKRKREQQSNDSEGGSRLQRKLVSEIAAAWHAMVPAAKAQYEHQSAKEKNAREAFISQLPDALEDPVVTNAGTIFGDLAVISHEPCWSGAQVTAYEAEHVRFGYRAICAIYFQEDEFQCELEMMQKVAGHPLFAQLLQPTAPESPLNGLCKATWTGHPSLAQHWLLPCGHSPKNGLCVRARALSEASPIEQCVPC